MFKRRILLLLLVAAMLVSVVLPVGAETAKPVYLAFTSDVHNQKGDVSSQRLDGWLKTVSTVCGSTFADFGICGDLGPAAASSNSEFWNNAEKVFGIVENSGYVDGDGFIVCGNHEYNPGSYTHDKNDTTRKYADAGAARITERYILYSLGARQWDEKYSDADVEALSGFLNDHADFGGPIFILAHFPLHRYTSGGIGMGFGPSGSSTSGESTTVHDGKPAVGAAKLIAALNAAVEKNGQTIVFLWGHNHSSSHDHYDTVYTDAINDTPIRFLYAAAGCMSDSEYGKSADVKGKGLVAKIERDQLTLTYYNAAGTAVSSKAVPIQVKEDPVPGRIGDVDGDGYVTAADRVMLTRYLAWWHGDYDNIDQNAADVNRDGVVSPTDRLLLARYLAGGGSEYDAYFVLPA